MSDTRRSSGSSSAAPSIGSLPILVVVLSIVGLVLGLVVLFIHQRLAASQGAYTSFCDISEGVSCDVVLGSSYASFLGVPVGGWALLSYLTTGILAVYLMRAPMEKRVPAATVLLAATGAMLAVALYFFVISSFVLGVICPMCLSMDAVNIALFLAAWALFGTLRARASEGFSPSRFLGLAGLATLGGLVGLTWLQASGGPQGPMTVEEIKRNAPRFYAYYVSQPIVDAPMGDYASLAGDTPLTIVEFSDYKCPHCRRAFLSLRGLLAEEPDDLQVIHRNFPLSSECNPAIKEGAGRTQSCAAAIASECARQQGKLSSYNYLLFTNQDDLSDENLEVFAKQSGLDLDAFRACIDSPEAAAAVDRDVQDGIDAGIESTPRLFINGRVIKGGFATDAQYRWALTIERARLAQASGKETTEP